MRSMSYEKWCRSVIFRRRQVLAEEVEGGDLIPRHPHGLHDGLRFVTVFDQRDFPRAIVKEVRGNRRQSDVFAVDQHTSPGRIRMDCHPAVHATAEDQHKQKTRRDTERAVSRTCDRKIWSEELQDRAGRFHCRSISNGTGILTTGESIRAGRRGGDCKASGRLCQVEFGGPFSPA